MSIVEYTNFKGKTSRVAVMEEFNCKDHVILITKYGRAIDVPPTSILGRWEI